MSRLCQESIMKLNGKKMLDDEIMNFYIDVLKRRYPSTRIAIFSTFFFEKIRRAFLDNVDKEKEYLSCERWLKKAGVDFTQLEFIFVPVNFSRHWTLVLFCLQSTRIAQTHFRPSHLRETLDAMNSEFLRLSVLPKETYYDTVYDLVNRAKEVRNSLEHRESNPQLLFEISAPCAFTLDSLPITHTIPQDAVLLASDYIVWQYKRFGINYNRSDFLINEVVTPKQRSSWECGVFVLFFIRIFVQFHPKTLPEYIALLQKFQASEEKELVKQAAGL
ncbi:sentrin/sumo-specific protease, putative [Entamoeba invadens IP1]|uniref:Sentrin/sumo-specific protease, putative n=1 Tax=Entamoeba invadens IP1 TaxID=370355 RepID=A0A0A1UBP7_ENTIV|nr:sentrin/sumo-specific protease, putative [Entamoeba invadens IP1]ELP91102.1 sentrin/sumo-specific protease, putative [Entamoeba invadens IP1]|eukprot:XP_004257873.1 sentrin/sumo-specific protease, putative [Entamoeba invadens IP1]